MSTEKDWSLKAFCSLFSIFAMIDLIDPLVHHFLTD